MATQELSCPLCSLTSHLKLNVTNFLKHIKLFHAHQAGFKLTCGIHGCQRTFINFRTFENHVSAMHRSVHDSSSTEAGIDTFSNVDTEISSLSECADFDEVETSDESEDDFETTEDPPTSQDHEAIQCSSELLQESSALFLLGLKEKYKLTQVAVQGVLEGVTNLSQQRLNLLHSKVIEVLSEAGVDVTSCKEELGHLFADDGEFGHPFCGLESEYQQRKYFKTHFDFVEPVRVCLGERRVWKGKGTKRKCVLKEDHFIYIPILETIQCLLRKDTILSEVKHGHTSLSAMKDFCDGRSFRVHPLFSIKANALQVFLYFDELETCNPLGSKTKKHKLGNFYFSLGNLPPKHRSKLSSIQLLAIVKTNCLSTYGMDAVLHPIVEDLKKLETGVNFEIDGRQCTFFGTLALVSADNLGSLALGGFKESCTAYRLCRHCMATKETSATMFFEHQFTLRTKALHQEHCAKLAEDASASKEYGINRDSILNELKYFHVCDGSMVPDVMHDVLEGLLQYEIKLMLQEVVYTESYISLGELNTRLECLELGHMESKDRPTQITQTTLQSSGNSLKQNASQMWLLGRILPLLIADHVPSDDDHWQLFLQLMEIVDHLFCPQVSEDEIGYLSVLINDHHTEFTKLYPNKSVIPKMHFLVHTPRLIYQYGPLVRHWTMRYEAKHSYFKRLSQSIGNFINLPHTLAMRHQYFQCYLSTSTDDLIDIEVGPGNVETPDTLPEHFEAQGVYKCKKIKCAGIEYRNNDGVILSNENDVFQVGEILNIYILDGNTVLFQTRPFMTYFNAHYRIYLLKMMNDVLEKFVLQRDLLVSIPVHIRSSSNFFAQKFVIFPHYI